MDVPVPDRIVLDNRGNGAQTSERASAWLHCRSYSKKKRRCIHSTGFIIAGTWRSDLSNSSRMRTCRRRMMSATSQSLSAFSNLVGIRMACFGAGPRLHVKARYIGCLAGSSTPPTPLGLGVAYPLDIFFLAVVRPVAPQHGISTPATLGFVSLGDWASCS